MRANLPLITQDQAITDYIKQISVYPILDAEEEYALAKRVHDCQDLEAAHDLITSHLRLVVKIAINMRGYGIALMDLISEGNIGLMHAVKKFKPDLGYRLSTYAMWWIKAAMQEFIIKSWSLVKIGTTAAQKKLFFNLNKIKKRINILDGMSGSRELSREDTKKIASELDLPEKDIKEMNNRLSLSDASLDSPIILDNNEEAGTLLETIKDDTLPNQESIIIDSDEENYRKQLFQEAILTCLDNREKDILSSRHLVEKPITLEDLSKKYDISRERIRQIEARALKKVKNFCNSALA